MITKAVATIGDAEAINTHVFVFFDSDFLALSSGYKDEKFLFIFPRLRSRALLYSTLGVRCTLWG